MEIYLSNNTDKNVYLKALRKVLKIETDKVYTSELPPVSTKEGPDSPQPTLRIVIPLSGVRTPKCYINGQYKYLKMEPGNILIVPLNCYLGSAKRNNDTTIEVIFWNELIRYIYYMPNKSFWYHTKSPVRTEGFSMVQSLCALPNDKRFNPTRLNLVSALINLALVELEDDNSETHGKAYHTYSKALNYILRNLAGNLSRDIIAKECGITETHLYRLFITFANMDVVSTVRRFRLRHAEILLAQTNLNIKEIADLSGFNKDQTFIRVFKQAHGVSPGRYRTEIQNGLN